MEKKFLVLIFYILVLLTVFGSSKSDDSDTKIENMLEKAISDPVYIGSFVLRPGNGLLRVTQRIYYMIVEGLSKAKLIAKSDLRAGTVQLSYTVKRLRVNVLYDIDGYCLLMPIWGKGKGLVIIDDVKASINATVATANGKHQIIKMKVSFDVNGGSIILSSLFGEDPPGFWTLFYGIFLNSNAKYILNEVISLYLPDSEKYFISLFEPIINVA